MAHNTAHDDRTPLLGSHHNRESCCHQSRSTSFRMTLTCQPHCAFSANSYPRRKSSIASTVPYDIQALNPATLAPPALELVRTAAHTVTYTRTYRPRDPQSRHQTSSTPRPRRPRAPPSPTRSFPSTTTPSPPRRSGGPTLEHADASRPLSSSASSSGSCVGPL